MRKWMSCLCIVCLMLLTACESKPDETTPEGITELFLTSMKTGDYKKACEYAGINFDQTSYDKSAALQKKTMKESYAAMEFKVGKQKVSKKKATVDVEITNTDYLEIMNQAVYDTMKNKKDDAYTEKKFMELLKKAKKNKANVLVIYRQEKGKWVFDGSNSQLYAAMLGYLK